MKVFNHDARSGGCFPTRSVDPETKEQKRINEDDPDAGRFSILDGIDKYKKDGVFHIKLCYPEYTEEFPCNEWTQSSNFERDREITDYKPIRITYKHTHSRNSPFLGLLRKTYGPCELSSTYPYRFEVGFCCFGLGPLGKPNVRRLEIYLAAGILNLC